MVTCDMRDDCGVSVDYSCVVFVVVAGVDASQLAAGIVAATTHKPTIRH